VPTQEICTDPERGLGLGLSFVAWIAKAHGGAIQVASTPGKGTRFTISLPVGLAVVVPIEAAGATVALG
jgi:signal transduction histidine kinase